MNTTFGRSALNKPEVPSSDERFSRGSYVDAAGDNIAFLSIFWASAVSQSPIDSKGGLSLCTSQENVDSSGCTTMKRIKTIVVATLALTQRPAKAFAGHTTNRC